MSICQLLWQLGVTCDGVAFYLGYRGGGMGGGWVELGYFVLGKLRLALSHLSLWLILHLRGLN